MYKLKYHITYLIKNPWARKYYSSKINASKLNRKHNMKVIDFKELWIRDKAYLLKEPSIDRINPKKGYIKSNCRFIERRENCRLGSLGRKYPPRTHCVNGHEMKDLNIYIPKDGRRRCRKCRSIRSINFLKNVNSRIHN